MNKQLTLQQLVAIISGGFRTLFEEFEFWVTAEIADIKPYKSRLYISLIQADQTGSILAKAKGIIWEPSVMQKFMKHTKISRSELVGTTILMRGSCSFHDKYGWSISIKEISSEYTRGVQVNHREKIIQELKASGLWKINQSKTMRSKPLHLAVVTGRGSSGYEDFVSILVESSFTYDITPYYSAVHGNKALIEVPKQLDSISRQLYDDPELYDVVLIVRGGGGKDGFLRQDDKTIATYVSQMPLPVIVAVGHTRDTTLLDSTCWWSAKTPSEAATLLIDRSRELYEQVKYLDEEIKRLCDERIKGTKEEIGRVYDEIQELSTQRIEKKLKNITELYQSIKQYDPLIQLQHGYAIVSDEEGVRLMGGLEVGQSVKLYLGEEVYEVQVKNKE